MPYDNDGVTWVADGSAHVDGMAENKPGHKSFEKYELPSWCKHPLTHPSSGIAVDNSDYAYACAGQGTGSALDGMGNCMGRGPAHIAAMYGDMEMLESCTDAELNARDCNGRTAAHTAAELGMPWVLQWLVEKGSDTTSGAVHAPHNATYTPEELIWVSNRNHQVEMEWLDLACKGELSDKKSMEAQEYKLKRWRCEGLDSTVDEWLDASSVKQRLHMYKTGEWPLPFPQPTEDEVRARGDLPSSRVKKPALKGKPPLPLALMFPGVGSQYVGMMKDCMDLPGVQDLLDTSKKILGWDLKDLVLNGPEDKLSETRYCQPAMFVAGMAGLEMMKADAAQKEAVERPQAVCGLSLGELTALCCAGVLSFEDGLKLIKVRADAMQKATDAKPQAMASVAGLDSSVLEKLCSQAVAEDKSTEDPICQIANALFPSGYTVSGTKATVEKLCALAKDAKALQARLIKTGGAYHTPLMASAEKELSGAIDSMLDKMEPPRCAIYFNVTGKRVPAGSSPSQFVDLIKKQLTQEVLWLPTMKQMIMDGVKDFYEVGPLKQLKSMLKRIDQDAFKRTENIAV